MRFLVLSSLARDSGCALRARHLADALRRLGHEVRRAPLPRSLPGFLDLPLIGLLALPEIFLRRYDAAVVIKPYPTLLWPLLLRRRFGGGRVVTDVDDIDFSFRSGFGARALAALQKPLPGLCDLVTTHNDTLQAHIESFHGVPARRIHRLDQGVALDLYRPLPAPDRARLRSEAVRRAGWDDGPLLLYAGHLNVASELGVILDLFPNLLRTCPSARLVVAGGGPLLNSFQDLAREKVPPGTVFFTGWQTPEQINEWMNAADLALVYYPATKANGNRVSMKIRECLAAGIPVVANDFGDLAQFRDFTRSCPTDPAAFEAAIREAILRPPERETTAARARALIRERWDWDSIARGLVRRLETGESVRPAPLPEAERQGGSDQ